jgi:hypothetical protein
MTYAEPNALPPLYSSWQEWREVHAQHVADFQASAKGASDVLQLKIRLQRLGYFGARLDDEIEFIKS